MHIARDTRSIAEIQTVTGRVGIGLVVDVMMPDLATLCSPLPGEADECIVCCDGFGQFGSVVISMEQGCIMMCVCVGGGGGGGLVVLCI